MQINVNPITIRTGAEAPVGRSPDYVAIIERAYSTSGTDVQWLGDVLEAAQPALDEQMGVHAWLTTFSATEMTIVDCVVLDRPDAGELIAANMDLASIVNLPHATLLATGTTNASWLNVLGHIGLMRGGFRECFQEHDVSDMSLLRCYSNGIEGPVLAAWRPRNASMHPRRRAALDRVARHVAAGFRLRRHLRSADIVEAVIDPSKGTIEHAEGDAKLGSARTALLRAAQQCETSRGPMRRLAPEQALAQWQELVAGRWSLVETIESDGRRYLLARPNAEAWTPRTLSRRELQVAALVGLGCSEKSIAFDLGLSPATISVALSSTLRKLGLSSPAELITAFER